jgi:murein DD-endopeptidase MepM/ murein hydrolase activator NlpD
VLWGGRTVPENRHSVSADMRFAYDFLVHNNDMSFEGDGSRKEQYYCWDRPVLAAGEGLVVEVVSNIPDNIPGTVNPDKLYGNHVLIDHGNGEVSLVAHLEKGSTPVKRGQMVHAGEVIGRCGNSGNSTEPHLHFQLMTGRRYLKAFGLPAQFENYLADGKRVIRGEPHRGQMVEPIDTGEPPPDSD